MIRHAFPAAHYGSAWYRLVHLLDESINVLLPVAQVSTLDEMNKLPLVEATVRVREFEWPEEVASLLEVRTNSEDFVNQVLHADDAEFAQVVLDQLVVCKRDSLLVDLAISTLVH